MLIVYIKCKDPKGHVKCKDPEGRSVGPLESQTVVGWLVYGNLTSDVLDAQVFHKITDVYEKFMGYCSIKEVQFDIYKIVFDGWTVGEYDFECEAAAEGAARVLNLPVVQSRRYKKPCMRLQKIVENLLGL